MNKSKTAVFAAIAFVQSSGFLHSATVAWWRFDDGSSSTLANSASTGAMYNATKVSTGSESTSQISGPFINDGSGNYYSNTSSYNNGGTTTSTGSLLLSTATSPLSSIFDQASFTIEALVYISASPLKFGAMFSNNETVNHAGSFLFSTDTNGFLRLYATSSTGVDAAATSLTVLAASQWYNVAAVGTWNGTNTSVQMYINGVASGTPLIEAGGLKIDPSLSFAIGSKNPWNGYIDELRISNTAFTSSSQFLSASAVPEPGVVSLAIIGLLVTGHSIRKRVRNA